MGFWSTMWTWIKGLFGGKGNLQIGKGNTVVSGSTSGGNSPVVNASGPVTIQYATTSSSLESDLYAAELEADCAALLNLLATDLREHPHVRLFGVAEKPESISLRDDHFGYTGKEFPDFHGQLTSLFAHNLIEELELRSTYRITEPLFRYLWFGRIRPNQRADPPKS